ncbi:S41 family peptidase [Maricaulis maris]|uniref:Peptidase S41-like protein n=1 Tax=Maricaulis maris TaxID=74318 RepID=A0A495D2G3_9PROT|nr:S41 family peptidase [Maricaulis maris]RKQ95957.1 peptidase S41-like protein [Maricaulis maris]
MIKSITTSLAFSLALTAISMPVAAQTPLSASDRERAIGELSQIIEDEFFDAERATAIAADLRAAEVAGAFDAITDGEGLATALTTRLSAEDRHFGVNHVGRDAAAAAMAGPRRRESDPSDARPADPWAPLRRQNFGFARVEILAGNIGYIDLRQFAPIAPAEQTARAALEFVAGTDAVIFDVRQNGGGAPSMVQYLISHFLEPGGDTLINTFVSRDYEYPNQLWSLPSHPAGHRPDVPLYVLTSARTGSAGEAFPYHLQALERATLIGETTYGAGNPGGTYFTASGFAIFVSTGSARNPITGTNWESTGVTPHIATSADAALDTALSQAYATLLEGELDDGARLTLEWALEGLSASADPVILTTSELARYAGEYGIRAFSVEDGRLAYSRDGRPAAALEPLGNHRFRLAGDDDARFVFVVEASGAASRMDLHLADGRVLRNTRND